MRRVRILLAGMPPMLQQIVEQATRAAPDLELVGTAPPVELESAVDRTRADVAIIALPDATAVGAYEELLYRNPRLRLLAITEGGRDAILYELRPQVVVLGELAAEGLLEVLRMPRGAAWGGTS